MFRKYTNKMYDLIEDGCVDTKSLAEQLLYWLSEDDVKEFFFANGFNDWDDEEVDD